MSQNFWDPEVLTQVVCNFIWTLRQIIIAKYWLLALSQIDKDVDFSLKKWSSRVQFNDWTMKFYLYSSMEHFEHSYLANFSNIHNVRHVDLFLLEIKLVMFWIKSRIVLNEFTLFKMNHFEWSIEQASGHEHCSWILAI